MILTRERPPPVGHRRSRRSSPAMPHRTKSLTLDWNDWRVDFSKERIDRAALAALLGAAEAANLAHWIAALFAGEKINLSERRPVLHTAAARTDVAQLFVDGDDVTAEMRATRERMRALAARRSAKGARKGATGRPLRSRRQHRHRRLRSRAAARLRRARRSADSASGGPDVAFVSNVDPEHLTRALADRDPATTLFIVTSKTFTTQETLANAQSARAWLRARPGRRARSRRRTSSPSRRTSTPRARSACATPTSCRCPKASAAAIRCGRPSASSIARSRRLAGVRRSARRRAGDGHAFPDGAARAQPAGAARRSSATGMRAGSGIGSASSCPYAQALARLPAYLQQLTLESNGKSVLRDGTPVDGPTAPALWGDVGTDSQHAFFQWLHQGTHEVPVEFIVPVRARASAARPADAARRERARAGAGADGGPRTTRKLRAELAAQRTRGGRARRGGRRAPLPRQPRVDDAAAAGARCAQPRRAARALRAPHVRRRRALRHQFVRPVGRRTGQDAREADRRGACRRRAAAGRHRCVDARARRVRARARVSASG